LRYETRMGFGNWTGVFGRGSGYFCNNGANGTRAGHSN
jgi:hypothetical protein